MLRKLQIPDVSVRIRAAAETFVQQLNAAEDTTIIRLAPPPSVSSYAPFSAMDSELGS